MHIVQGTCDADRAVHVAKMVYVLFLKMYSHFLEIILLCCAMYGVYTVCLNMSATVPLCFFGGEGKGWGKTSG